jgi:hypothetical protein
MSDWYSTTKEVSSIEIEICFLLQTHYGDRELTLPAFERQVPSLVRSSEVIGREIQLAEYYSQIIERARNCGALFNEISQYFWMRLFLWNTEAHVLVTFPWYDTYSEIKPLLDRFLAGQNGELFFDIDQGWQIEVALHEGRIYIRCGDPDEINAEGEDHESITLVNFRNDVLLPLISPLVVRTESTIRELTRLLGDDVWTRQKRAPELHPIGHK